MLLPPKSLVNLGLLQNKHSGQASIRTLGRAFPEHFASIFGIGGKNFHVSVEVQNAQRSARMGTSLKHSGHFFVVGSGGTSPRFRRAIMAFTGITTKK